MEKEKTAIDLAIEEITEWLNVSNKLTEISKNAELPISESFSEGTEVAFKSVISKLQELKATEKQQMEDEYYKGFKDGNNYIKSQS